MHRGLSAAILCILLSSCAKTDLAVIWSSYPEISQYVEIYNKTLIDAKSPHRIISRYYEDPLGEFMRTDSIPDLIIAPSLASQGSAAYFRDLLDFFPSEHFSERIYDALLASGFVGKNLVFLPLAFDLPLVFFPRAIETTIAPYVMSIQDIETLSSADSSLQFSPMWNTELLFYMVQLHGASFHANQQGILQWNQTELDAALQSLSTWIDKQGGVAQALKYQQRYLYSPSITAVENGYADLSFAHAGDFLQLPPLERTELAYRWLGTHSSIPVLYESVYAAIPRKSIYAREASSFLQWLTEEEIQEHILNVAKDFGIVRFGLLGKFSSLIHINDMVLPEIYDELKGRMPPKSDLLFPPSLPQNWNILQQQVIAPWLLEALTSTNTEVFSAVLENWQKQLSNK